MKDQDTDANEPNNLSDEANGEGKAIVEDPEGRKRSSDLEDLRQSLLRHQADFANYRKRAE